MFGVDDAVYRAIYWHTTGHPNMTKLEKIIYLADYIEPSRDFPGVEQHPLAVGAPVSRYEYITVFRIKQDAQAVFVFASMGIGGENVQICLAVGQKQILFGVYHLCIVRHQNSFLRWEDEDVRFHPA